MKTMKYITSFCFIALLMVFGCDDDENIDFINNVAAPTNVSAGINVIPDNTGLTQITPTGDGVASYIVDFGDGSESSEALAPGEYTEHMYVEGTYEATITATGINGKSATGKQMVNVSFRAPENIVINTAIDGGNPFILNVSADADFASSFLVFFDTSNPDEEGTLLELDGTVSNEYPGVGDYSIKVIALSGGLESSELEQVVTITAPVVFPVDFEVFDASALIGFGGASNEIIDNPDTNGNTSATVAKIVKDAPEVWAGNAITMSSPIDFNIKKAMKMKVWSPRPGGIITMKLENLDDRDIFIEKKETLEGNSAWEEVTFNFSDIDESQEYQKIVIIFDDDTVADGSANWTFYIDDIDQSVISSGQTGLPGQWILAPEAGALGIGPSLGDLSFFNCDADCVTLRACYYDDVYVFGEDGSFQNQLGAETWTEPWQGGGNSCGTPVAPHDGSNPATYTYDEAAGTFTLNGVGAYVGLAKVFNGGELTSPADAPASITYNIEFIDNDTISVYIDIGGGTLWQYRLIRAGVVATPLTGTWQLAPEAGALGIGPSLGDISFFNCDADCVTLRACYYDDAYVFGSDGSFQNIQGSETWTEGWQGGSDSCGTPVAPHDGSSPATYSYDEASSTFTLNGVGAYVGLSKVFNGGELTSPGDAPDAIVYNVEFIDSNTISVNIDIGGGTLWQYKLVKI